MKLLAIDTSTEACSASLLIHDQTFTEFQVAPREHTQLIFPMMESLLQQAKIKLHDIDVFTFGKGPGSFTGVRIAASIIQGIAFAMNKPVVAVSTLQAMAQGALKNESAEHVLVAIDARMQEVYWSAYSRSSRNVAIPLIEEKVCKPENVVVPDHDKWIAVGTGWSVHKDTLQQQLRGTIVSIHSDYYPNAEDIAYLAKIAFEEGKFLDDDQALPTYLRDKVTN